MKEMTPGLRPCGGALSVLQRVQRNTFELRVFFPFASYSHLISSPLLGDVSTLRNNIPLSFGVFFFPHTGVRALLQEGFIA